MAFQQDYKLADYFSVIGLDEELNSTEQPSEGNNHLSIFLPSTLLQTPDNIELSFKRYKNLQPIPIGDSRLFFSNFANFS